MGGALTGPARDVIRFADGTVTRYTPPRDTGDPRYEACTGHRPGCDCREAALAEEISELRAELNAARKAAKTVLAGHPTYAYERDAAGGYREIGCACTGCRIARAGYLVSGADNGALARDEVDGLTPEQVTSGHRWLMCTELTIRDHPGICDGSAIRWGGERGPFHEHLFRGGQPVPAVERHPA